MWQRWRNGSIDGHRDPERSFPGVIRMTGARNTLYEEPAYGLSEAAVYVKVPYTTLRYWVIGFGKQPAIIKLAESDPARLSFFNLLECHALAGMRKMYNL